MVERKTDFLAIASRKHQGTGFDFRQSQINSVSRISFNLSECLVPLPVNLESPRLPQDPIRVLVSGNISEGSSVGGEQPGRLQITCHRQKNVAGLLEFVSKKLVRFHDPVAREHHRGMVGPQISKDDIKGNGLGALLS
ncbi:hypothetical protein SDC9_184697 [bioreactor metagenome]|uniref:Uncharacterized protein n=1 Tax=bioreactor metagenome TaxID=1076179 RepID=A0A645HDT9_9ZZZZ